MSRKHPRHGVTRRERYIADVINALGLPWHGTKLRDVANAVADAKGGARPIGKDAQWAIIYNYWQEDVPLVLRYKGRRASRRPKQYHGAGPQRPVNPNSDKFLSSFEWRRLRMEVLTERGNRCECCGMSPKDGIVIHVDHIKPRSRYPDLALTKSNLQVLCEVCNHGKGSRFETDWRALAPDSEREMDTPVSRSGDGDGHQPLTTGAATFRDSKSASRPKLVREKVAR